MPPNLGIAQCNIFVLEYSSDWLKILIALYITSEKIMALLSRTRVKSC